ncbi:uncharacterized protein B0T23DRAFT_381968 [Neurospora hispaniola]|uniref:Uncharacterized protein n=1 Tax=Neurospora hispaniola TaxID=588809 RepID=A0AAJ0I5K5_9PEZI|nr:hypothetical protein B0T23DRAFT_381968 [Neurospora hispaniola]
MSKVEARRASARSRTRSALSATEALEVAAAVGGGRSLRPRRAGSQGGGAVGAAAGVAIGRGATSNLGPASPLRRSARSGDSAAGAARNCGDPRRSFNGRRGDNNNTTYHNIRPRRSSINYREDSSDDSDSASTTSDESDSEEEEEEEEEEDGERDERQPARRSAISSTRGRPSRTELNNNTRAVTSGRQALGKRRRPRSGFFHEDTDGEDDDIVNTDQESPPTPRRARATAISVARARDFSVPRTPERKRRKGTPATATKRRTPASSRKSKLDLVHSGGADEDTAEKEPKVIPPWQHLPYELWLLIFKFASAERDRDAVNLLLSASRLCRELAEPALTALYYSPPLLTRKMAHGLVALLSSDPSKMKYRYRWKVKKLRIDVEEIASKTYKGQHLDWEALFANVPQLMSIDFFHAKDDAPFRSLEASLRWKYPTALWNFLNGGDPPGTKHKPLELEAWRWNGRLMTPDMTLQSPAIIHQTPAFSNLKKLCLQNFQVPSMPLHNWPAVVQEDEGFENFLISEFAHAINVLPQLEYLSIESSTIANDYLLRLLPKTLKTLELVNCWEITADDFSEYLLTRAYHLEHLYLKHNQSLSLSFLTVLGTACPHLQTLSVDLKTYNHHEFYNDSDPSYDEVLSVQEVPEWPVSLRTLELQNMRKWSADAAENLFQSLIKAAPDLPDLRIIDINAKLNIPIRQRSEMRDRWEARLKGVFLRKWEDPKPPFKLRPPPTPTPNKQQIIPTFSTRKLPPSAIKRSRTVNWVAQSIEAHQGPSSSLSTRRSARIAALSSGSSSSNGGTPSPSRGHSAQRGEREVSVASSLSLSAEALSLSLREANVAGEILYRHGWCEKVELQLDNQKLTEQTLTMEDFVDGSGDDDEEDSEWDGMDRDDDYGGGGYAW